MGSGAVSGVVEILVLDVEVDEEGCGGDEDRSIRSPGILDMIRSCLGGMGRV